MPIYGEIPVYTYKFCWVNQEIPVYPVFRYNDGRDIQFLL